MTYIILPRPAPRFVTAEQLRELLEWWRLTAVGYTNWRPTRYERMLRAVELFEERNGKTPGAYKDLCAALEG